MNGVLAASDVLRMLPLRQPAPPRQRPRQEPEQPPGVTCRGCGVILPRSRMRNCPDCFAELPGGRYYLVRVSPRANVAGAPDLASRLLASVLSRLVSRAG